MREIHYSRCFNDDNISKIVNLDLPEDSNLQIEQIKQYNTKAKKAHVALPKGQTTKIKEDLKWESSKNIIFEHGIDFLKFGWVTKVAKILGCTPQHVHKWMNRHQTEFYNSEKCFKRKFSAK